MSFKDIFPYLIIAVLMYMLISGGKEDKNVIEIPAKSNEFVVNDPQPIIKYDTIFRDSLVEKVVRVENPVNEELLRKYEQAQDSLKYKLYRSAITHRTYEETFRDNNQEILVMSEVIGTLKRQTVKYNIPEDQIEYKNPSQGLWLGAGAQFNHQYLSVPQPELNLSYLKGKQMYTIGVDPNQIRINYKMKLL